MSTTIDNRVVEMQFDNQHFEKNVKTTLSTLEKLKQSLKLSGASSGLENVSAAAKKCDFTPMSNAVENVKLKFSALEVMAVTALANITNSAVNAGKRIVSALTIAPIRSGLQEYETQINSVQTIMANVSQKGKTLDDVNAALDELNEYADMTIYNFTEMTRNIGLFTNAGVGLDESVSSIKGFSNAAAMAGTDATRTAGAMYQLSQAMSSGRVLLMDWRSLEQANITGERFRETIMTTARAHGIAIDEMVAKEGNLRDTLRTGWLTADLMAEALNHYTLSTETMTEAEQEAARVKMRSIGYTEEQIDQLFALGTEATNAATKVKTFTQLWSVLQEAAQSGWSQTWRTVIGDFYEAREFFTELSDLFTGIIGRSSDKRNTLLTEAFTSNWDKLISRIGEADVSAANFEEQVRQCAEAGGVNVDALIDDFGSLGKAFKEGAIDSKYLIQAFDNLKNGMTSTSNAITADLDQITQALGFGSSGEQVKILQTALTELGYSLEQYGIDGLIGDETTKAIKAFQEASGLAVTGIVDQETLNALKEAGTSIEQIGDASKLSEMSIDDLANSITKLGGRELAISGLMNVIKGTIDLFGIFGKAWDETFEPLITAEGLYSAIETFQKFSEGLRLVNDETGEFTETGKKLSRTFHGVLAVVDMAATVFGGTFRIGFKALKGLLASFDLDILEFTANMGDALVALRDWLDVNFSIEEAAYQVGIALQNGYQFLRAWLDELYQLPEVQEAISKFRTAFADTFEKMNVHIQNAVQNFRDFIDRTKQLITDLGGLKNIDLGSVISDFYESVVKPFFHFEGVFDSIVGLFDTLKTKIVAKFNEIRESLKTIDFKAVLSGVLSQIGEFLSSMGTAISTAASSIFGGLKSVFAWLKDNLSLGDVLAGLIGGGLFSLIRKLSGFLDTVVDTIKNAFGGDKNKDGLKALLSGISETFDSLKESLNAFTTGIKIGSIVLIAVAIAILAASLKSIAKLDVGSIIKSLLAIALMMTMLALTMRSMAKSLGKFGSTGLAKAAFSMILVAAAVRILAKAMKQLGNMSLLEIGKGLLALAGGLALLVAALKVLGSTKISLRTSIAMIALAFSCSLLADALKSFAVMKWDEIGRGLAAMGGALGEVVAAMAILNRFGGGKSILGSIGILITVLSLGKLAEGLKAFAVMTWDEIGRGLAAMGGALLEVGGITAGVGALAGFSAILGGAAIWVTVQSLDELANALKKFSSMTWDEIGRGLAAMGGALLEVAALSGGLGYLAGFSGILGGAAIWVTVQSLDELANALKKFSSMTWDEIGRGLAAMGGALLEVGAITTGVGCFGGLASAIGGLSIGATVSSLDELANALIKFSGMSWDEIKQGLAAMGGALGEVALGGLANTFSGLGAGSISSIAASLGPLADSVKKWKDVTVPEGLNEQLKQLADGVGAFTFEGWGADAMATCASSIGVLADSAKKWKGVTVDKNLPDMCDTISKGVKKFWNAGIGDGTLANIAEPLGTLGDSLQKWEGVTVSSTIGSDLESIATGVKAFSFAAVGGWTISGVTDALTKLPGALIQWNGVTVSDTFDEDLIRVAKGISAFDSCLLTVLTADTISSFLSSMLDVLSKWSDISSPEDLSSNLTSLAQGINEFVPAAEKLASIDSVSIDALVSSLTGLAGLSFTDDTAAKISEIIAAISESFLSSGVIYEETGLQFMQALCRGFDSGRSKLGFSLRSALLYGVNAIRNMYGSFYAAGQYCGQGLVEGLGSKLGAVEAAAGALGAAAAKATNGALGVKSPSRVYIGIGEFVGKGFVIGLGSMLTAVADAGSALAAEAINSTQDTLQCLGNLSSIDAAVTPTIRPVVDLSKLQNGYGSIGSMFANQTLALADVNAGFTADTVSLADAISQMKTMNERRDNEIVSVISDLRADFDDLIQTVSGMKVRMNNGALVGEIITDIDTRLGRMSVNKRRGL